MARHDLPPAAASSPDPRRAVAPNEAASLGLRGPTVTRSADTRPVHPVLIFCTGGAFLGAAGSRNRFTESIHGIEVTRSPAGRSRVAHTLCGSGGSYATIHTRGFFSATGT